MTSIQAPHAGPAAPPGRPLLVFTSVALPAGWVFLGVPLVTGWPVEPFVLATLFLGMVPAALLLTRRTGPTSVRRLLHDCVRLPQPAAWLVPAALLVPVATAAGAASVGGSVSLGSGLALDLLANVVSSVLIINLWEEMVWAGFVQRTLTERHGFVGGALATAALFVGIHLPLSLYDADGAADVTRNVAIMIAAGVGLRLLVGALDSWGRRSLLAVAVLHAAFNASSDLVDADHDWIRYAVTLSLGALTLLAPSLRPRRRSGVAR